MPDLEPITRDEMLWSGEDLEPITRREMYIKHLYDETQVIPDKPITREEMFILKAGEELHDVTIEQLNVSENGTYSESGKAYSPVIVDVPLPENAYLLNDIEDLPKDIATFTDGSALPMPKLEVAIEPIQAGSGDPSPENIRPISGWDEANVTRCGKNIYAKTSQIIISHPIPNGTKVYTQIFGGTFAGASLYAKSLTSDWISIGNILSTKNEITINRNDLIELKLSNSGYSDLIRGNSDLMVSFTDFDSFEPYNGTTYTIDLDGTRYGGKVDLVSGVLTLTHGYIASYNGETLPSTWISDRDVYAEGTTPTIGAEVCYELATPTTIQLTPTQVSSLMGVNNIFADCGNIIDGQYFGKEV